MNDLMLIDIVGSIFIILLVGAAIAGCYDYFFVSPAAADKANSYCRADGFDQYKSFSRIGIFSRDPVAIKCEYAEKYTDLGVRVNG